MIRHLVITVEDGQAYQCARCGATIDSDETQAEPCAR